MRKKSALLCLLLAAVLLLSACGGTGSGKSAGKEVAIQDVDMSHYVPVSDNNRVFYEIFVGSFSDSNGDGTCGASSTASTTSTTATPPPARAWGSRASG